MNNEIIENHRMYLERKKLFIGFGYDIDKERDFILEQAKPLYGQILEAGTGKGHFAIALAKRGHSFVAFDISQEELHIAKLNLAYLGLDKCADFKVENAEHTTFPDGSFDMAFSVNTLHHFYSPYAVVDELIRILSHNGRIVLSDFTEEGFKVIDEIHALEGKTHEVSKITLADIGSYLARKGLMIATSQSRYQSVLVAGKELT